ncbi:MAG TPA: aminopeptidase P family protein [Desulfobacteraceae bacterium]|nr:aminopeptidase P family protein [Desulfobacteraceae bacterium]
MATEYRQVFLEEEITSRIKGLKERIAKENLDAALIVQKADRYYYTGTTQQGWLYVPVDRAPVFMVFKDAERAAAESVLEDIIPLLSPKKIPDVLNERGIALPKRLGLELDVMPANTFFMFNSIFGSAEIHDVSPSIRLQRAVKSGFEIECIRKSSALADKVAASVPELAKPGITEVELAGLVEARARKLGHQGTIRMRMWDNDLFYGHIMCGPEAAVPGSLASPTAGAGMNPFVGQGPSFKPLERHQPLLVDYVFARDGYLSDHARIFSLGELDDEFYKAHEAMRGIQDMVKQMAVPGAVTGDVYAAMVDMAKESGYGAEFMGAAPPKIRFTGHGVGIELDEFPFIAQGQTLPLESGMVIALEPKVILPGKGVVGVENTCLVTPDGLEMLTRYPEGITRID